ncbi:hypothetical protein CVT24_008820 [Panaeolus cyanescens]|uniref:SMODS and SLOG-associating 2TM effector domain-containing protein n=1 Tax=Panaeolus cyanescens TaxID=181874 RepID=A0A409VKB5_9AGAR|nr:hypothetical protein CVT24_008820 [Panaeolus cyanescens]
MDPKDRPLPIPTSVPTPQPEGESPLSHANPQTGTAGQPNTTLTLANVTQPERLPPIAEVRPYEGLRSPDILSRSPSQIQREPLRRASPSSIEKIPDDTDTLSGVHEIHVPTSPNQGIGLGQPLPAPLAPGRIYDPTLRRVRTLDRRFSAGPQSEIDHIVPTVTSHAKTVYDRLQPTLEAATAEMHKYERKAKFTGWALNAAIGLQVLLGSLTTGLSAVATSGRSAAVNTTILGALSTIVASYLARARGSNEPELSITRTKDLEQFIREVRAFQLDHGHATGKEWTPEVERLRNRFEDLLGNANGERKLSPPV